jgi:hypothetical protein
VKIVDTILGWFRQRDNCANDRTRHCWHSKGLSWTNDTATDCKEDRIMVRDDYCCHCNTKRQVKVRNDR